MSSGKTPSSKPVIESYPDLAPHCEPHDPAAFDVAAIVRQLIRDEVPAFEVEHVGSTSVEGCEGKGIVDLLLVYPDGMLEEAKQCLERLGFEPMRTKSPFPDTRPMRIGALRHNDKLYRLHVHVVCADSEEVQTLQDFRDRLRSDPSLRDAYVAKKKAIVASGVKDPYEYTKAKSAFFTDPEKAKEK